MKPNFHVDCLRRDLQVFQTRFTKDATKVFLVSKGSTYTRLWTHKDWTDHMSIARYARHIRLWPYSTIAWRIFPVCGVVVAWALCVKELDKYYSLKLPFTCGLLFGQAITLLLTLRTNQSMARLHEARGIFDRLVVACRDLASISSVYVRDDQLKVLVARYVAMMGWSLKAVVRGPGDLNDLTAMLDVMLPNADVPFLLSAHCMPLALVRRLRTVLDEILRRDAIDRGHVRTFEMKLGLLNDLVGACEKIHGTPSPPAYTRHTSRVLLVFLFIVPMGLADLHLPVHFLVAASAFITYLLVGIEEIGVELEEPFRWLPLHELCTNLLKDIDDQFAIAPPLPFSAWTDPPPPADTTPSAASSDAAQGGFVSDLDISLRRPSGGLFHGTRDDDPPTASAALLSAPLC